MTEDELTKITEFLFHRVKNIPGIDRRFIRKCLIGLDNMGDKEVKAKLKQLKKLL